MYKFILQLEREPLETVVKKSSFCESMVGCHRKRKDRAKKISPFHGSHQQGSYFPSYASVNSTCAQLPPGLLRGICPPCKSRGWGICKFCTARGPGICQPPGHSRAFDTHAVSYQNITTQKVLLEKSRLAHLSRTGINGVGL